MENYYDLDSNRIFTRGVKDFNTINSDTDIVFKPVVYKSVLENLYIINQYGMVINLASEAVVQSVLNKDGFPSVVLSGLYDNKFISDKFRIVDLVACSFIRNSEYYLERGYNAINKNGNVMDNYYTNIEYK